MCSAYVGTLSLELKTIAAAWLTVVLTQGTKFQMLVELCMLLPPIVILRGMMWVLKIPSLRLHRVSVALLGRRTKCFSRVRSNADSIEH